MSIEIEQLKNNFLTLAAYGRQENGGMHRLSWSPEFMAAQKYVQKYMVSIGMTTEIDAIGNLIGTFVGKQDLPPVMVGSHLDTVPNGGAFDGALGIITALECVRSWHEEGFRPLRPLKVIAFAEEEGTRFGGACVGSQFMAGELYKKVDQDYKTLAGKSLLSLLAEAQIKQNPFAEQVSLPPDACFLELHIEQGNFLDKAHCSVGIVSAIVGIKRTVIHITGTANHAGTTAMDERQDALVAAAALIKYIYEEQLVPDSLYVATVGQLEVFPNAVNVVPGAVTLTIELRAEQMETIQLLKSKLVSYYKKLEIIYGVEFAEVDEHNISPLLMDAGLIELLQEKAASLTIPSFKLPSWAGHDAMVMGKYVPTAMLFVPSVKGVSHAPEELSRWEDIRQATCVLEAALKELASK